MHLYFLTSILQKVLATTIERNLLGRKDLESRGKEEEESKKHRIVEMKGELLRESIFSTLRADRSLQLLGRLIVVGFLMVSRWQLQTRNGTSTLHGDNMGQNTEKKFIVVQYSQQYYMLVYIDIVHIFVRHLCKYLHSILR